MRAWLTALLAITLFAPGLAAATTTADLVRVYKAEHRLELLHNGAVFKSYPISLGFNPLGTKRQEGDGRTPEGRYVIDWRNRHSHYHLSLHISYPDAADKRWAKAHGVDPGGAIMIHGLPNGMNDDAANLFIGRDWTAGCIAVSNQAIREIWDRVPDGTAIVILP